MNNALAANILDPYERRLRDTKAERARSEREASIDREIEAIEEHLRLLRAILRDDGEEARDAPDRRW